MELKPKTEMREGLDIDKRIAEDEREPVDSKKMKKKDKARGESQAEDNESKICESRWT